MACNTIRTFELDLCQPSLGGIKKVYLAEWMANAAIITVTGNESATEIDKLVEGSVSAFAEGIVWKEYPMRKNTASMTSTLNNNAEGASYVTTELAMVFSKMETQKRIAVQALAIGQAMAVVEDSNGKRWFLGANEPLTATAGTGETGTAKADRNAYTITLTDESLGYPFELENGVTLNMTEQAEQA